MSGIVSIYCVFGSEAEALAVGRAMVERGLAACVNILGPCTSIYRWGGKVEQAVEVAAILKAAANRAEELVAALAAAHSYEVPAITVWPVEASLERYARWVMETSGGEG